MLSFTWAQAQWGVRGQITDEKGEALVGANVYILETKQGTFTNENGVYSIDGLSPGEYTIRYSYVGYKEKFESRTIGEGNGRVIIHVQLLDRYAQLDEVLVQATRVDEDSPFTYSEISKEELQKNNMGVDVPYLLQWTPSTVVTSDAGTGIGYTGIRIRGAAPTATNVTINGIPLNDSESHGVFWVDLPDFASSTNDIQIQRGVGTSTNGAAAFGASVNLNTNNFREDQYVGISSMVGFLNKDNGEDAFNSYKANVQFGSGLIGDHFTIEGRVSTIQSEGYIDRASADLNSWFLSGAYRSDKSLLRLNAFSGHEITYQSWYGLASELLETDRTYNEAGTDKPGEPYDNQVDDYQQDHYQALYNYQINKNWDFNVALHYTKGKGYYEEYEGMETLADYGIPEPSIGDSTVTEADIVTRKWLDNDFYGTTYSLDYISSDNRFKATYGGAWNRYDGDHFGEVIWVNGYTFVDQMDLQNFYDNNGLKTDFMNYIKTSYEWNDRLNVLAELQVRNINYEITGVDEGNRDISGNFKHNFFNPKVGANYAFNSNQSVYASMAIAHREPNRADYVDNPRGEEPNAERLIDYELGYRYHSSNLFINANVYYMDYKDQLVPTGELNDVGAYIRDNIPESYRMGIELDLGVDNIAGLVNVRANATLSDNRVKSYTAYFDNWETWGQETLLIEDAPLALSPNLIAGVDLGFNLLKAKPAHDLSANIMFKMVGKQHIDNLGLDEVTLPAYNFTNLRFVYGYKLPKDKRIEVIALVRNVFDQLYENNAWSYSYFESSQAASGGDLSHLIGLYPQAGRNFMLGVNLQF